MKQALFILLIACAITCDGQNRPSRPCSFPGFDDAVLQRSPNVAEIATKGPALTWLDCDSPKGCITLRSESGSPVLIYSVRGDWTCGYAQDSRGAGPVWIRSTDLRPIHYNSGPSLSAWLGTWTQDGNRIRIDPAQGGALHLKGHAMWPGIKGAVHFGDIAGDASPNGNHLHFTQDGADGCVVDMVLVGKFILANDNNGCGGMNVRFWGFWRRAPR